MLGWSINLYLSYLKKYQAVCVEVSTKLSVWKYLALRQFTTLYQEAAGRLPVYVQLLVFSKLK